MSQSIEDGLVERPYLLEELQNEADGIADGQGCFDQSLLRAARAAIEAQSDTITRLKEALEKCRAVAVKEYEFAKSAEKSEGSNPYREGAADIACEIMNDISKIVLSSLRGIRD